MAVACVAPYAVAAAAPALLAAKGAVAFTAGLSATGTLVAGAAGGGLAGFIATGSLKGALIGVASGVAFAQVVNMSTKGGSSANIGSKFASAGSRAAETMTAEFKVLAHGIVGGVRSVLSGARFVQGFLAAGFTEAFSPMISYAGASGGIAAEYSAAALIGGCGSQLAGGKFADGAMTGVFSRVFNNALHDREVHAVRSGTVERAGWQDPSDPNKGFGWRVYICQEDNMCDIYAHMDPKTTILKGSQVQAGDYVGLYADPTNGHSLGPHLHYQRVDSYHQPVNPGVVQPVVGGFITTPYGQTDNWHPTGHKGVDFASP